MKSLEPKWDCSFSITWGEHEGVCAPLAVNLQGRWADNLLAPGDELRL